MWEVLAIKFPYRAIAAIVHIFRHRVLFDHSMRFSAVITPNEFQGGRPLNEIRLVSLALPTKPLSLLNSIWSPLCVTVNICPDRQGSGCGSHRYRPDRFGSASSAPTVPGRKVAAVIATTNLKTDPVSIIFLLSYLT
jgi:hypothetical protein